MTDEEKKAIDILINEIADIVISEYCTHCKICENEDTECYYTKVIDIVYNLVQKQSKEIEELKETLKCTQNSWYEDTQKIEEMKKQIDLDNECEIALNSKVMDLEKEIEELKTINQMQKYRIEVIDERELISKDKTKEILGIEEDINNEKLLSLLQTIVDENARLEDIEDRKVQIEYNNVFNKGVKSVEDKIKAKIEEVKDGTFDAKIVLQSLLEKE